DEGRSREVPGGGRLGLPGEAGEHGAAAVGAAPLAASLGATGRHGKTAGVRGRAAMRTADRGNILLVDDQPSQLLSYEGMLSPLGENLIKASSGKEALEHLLRTEITVVVTDVSMPEMDGFELAEVIRQHPRYEKTAIIFVSAVHLTDLDRL